MGIFLDSHNVYSCERNLLKVRGVVAHSIVDNVFYRSLSWASVSPSNSVQKAENHFQFPSHLP